MLAECEFFMKKFSEIIEEIRKIKNLKSEAKVAELFGLLPQALNRYKRQNLIPFDKIVDFCARENISLDWLLLGRGEPAPAEPTEDIEKRLARLEKLMRGKK